MHTRVLHELSRAECWELLSERTVARIAWCDRGMPEIRPVNYRVDGEHLVLQSAPGGWHTGVDGEAVVLEVDDVDESTGTGRSVIVRGTARTLRPGSDELRVASVSWLPVRTVGVRVTPAEVTGRWLLPPSA